MVTLKVLVVRKEEMLIYVAFVLYEIKFEVVYVLLDTDLSCDHLLTPEASLIAFLLNF